VLVVALPRGLGLQPVLVGLMAVIISLLLPRWLLRSAAAGRQARIRAEVPLLTNLMVLLLEAGLSTRQALHSLVRDGAGVLPELGGEFRLALRQVDAGGDLGEVLTSMGSVLDVPELSGVLGVLRQVERYGGEVREPLLSALAVMEERRSLDLRERVNLLAGRMTVVMVLFFFPALMLCVAGPAFSSIFRALRQVAT
jgi:tight adherence protein C